MRRKKLHYATIDQVKITRNGEYAELEFADPAASGANIKIGPEVMTMTDQEILDVHNSIVSAMEQSVRNWDNVVHEIPPGRPQISYFEAADQWTPRGEVLRVHISESEFGEPEYWIDDKSLNLHEFAKLLSTFNGWGMRISFVPEEYIEEEPRVEVRDPADDCDEQ